MPLKQFTTDFQELAKDPYLRNDEKFHVFLNSLNWNLFGIKNKNLISLKDILIDDYNNFEYEEGEEYKGIPTGQTYLDEDGYIRESQLVTAEDHPGRLKYKVSNDNILISSLRLAKSPALYFENENLTDYVFSNGFYIYKVKEGWNRKFVLYILRTKRLKSILDNNIYRGIGISAYKDDDLKKIKIPVIPKSKQDQIVAEIGPIEKKIKKLKNQIIPPQEIINKVFAREFGFDLEKFEELKKERFFETDISEITTSLIRSTVVQNSLGTRFLKSFLKQNTIFLKDILIKPIKRGKQPEYTEGGIKVIKTLNIQKGQIVFDEVQFVSESFLKNNEEKAGVYKDNILLTSTGMGRGKFALYDNEETCFADSHISIIRFNKQRILPYFLNYYCQSFFGTEQLKYIEMHIKGTPEIYEAQLNYFQIPDIPLKSQQKIVDEIKTELDKQEEMKKKIETQRNKIDEIIEKAIL